MAAPDLVTERNDFRTDVRPTLFRDNWGRDSVAEHPDKIERPIHAAVALAQLLTSIREGEPLDDQTLDCSVLKGVIFVDGSDGESDHFFSLQLDSRYTGGSFDGSCVSATFKTGLVRLAPSEYGDPTKTYATYDERWSTRRADVISQRHGKSFDLDVERLDNATSQLSEHGQVTERPDTWPGVVDSEAYEASLSGLWIAEHTFYIGDAPLTHVAPEEARRVRIPFLDD